MAARQRLPMGGRAHVLSGRGHLEVLQWLHCNGCPWDAETCSRAAFGGHLEVLGGRAPTAAHGTRGAWRGGGGSASRCSVGARANGCPWTEWSVARRRMETTLTCSSGRANGCPWDCCTCSRAARAATSRCSSRRAPTAARGPSGRRGGRARQPRGAPGGAPTAARDAGMRFAAEISRRLEVLQWLRTNGCPLRPNAFSF